MHLFSNCSNTLVKQFLTVIVSSSSRWTILKTLTMSEMEPTGTDPLSMADTVLLELFMHKLYQSWQCVKCHT